MLYEKAMLTMWMIQSRVAALYHDPLSLPLIRSEWQRFIMIDRLSDPLTAMLTQYTYGGLIKEQFTQQHAEEIALATLDEKAHMPCIRNYMPRRYCTLIHCERWHSHQYIWNALHGTPFMNSLSCNVMMFVVAASVAFVVCNI